MKKLLVTLLIVASINWMPSGVSARALSGTCPRYEQQLTMFAPKGGWDTQRMSKYMFRESRCIPTVRSKSRDSGLLQINDINLSFLSKKFGFRVTAQTLMDPTYNIKAAAILCETARKWWGNCYHPWKK